MTAPGGAVRLDVRAVHPKDRYETIMEAYERIGEGEVMELTLDHDPSCMYYTLKATRGDDAFRFDYVDRGPDLWRVRVTKERDVAAVDPLA